MLFRSEREHKGHHKNKFKFVLGELLGEKGNLSKLIEFQELQQKSIDLHTEYQKEQQLIAKRLKELRNYTFPGMKPKHKPAKAKKEKSTPEEESKEEELQEKPKKVKLPKNKTKPKSKEKPAQNKNPGKKPKKSKPSKFNKGRGRNNAD